MKDDKPVVRCDHSRIDAFLNSDGPEFSDDEFLRHLDYCVECRTCLEQEAADVCVWEKLRQHLAPVDYDVAGVPEYSAATAVISGKSNVAEAVIDALAPTDDPHHLGRLGGHEITGVVGVGGMGVVLKAVDPALDRVVAIKVMPPHLANNATARRRFSREAKAAAAVLHPNVIPIYCVSSDEVVPHLVMAYIRGGSLQKRLDREGPLPTIEILRIGSQVAAGLAAAHEQGLVHRDIKPENILLEEGVERVTLTDFGLARAVDDVSVTREGTIAGTPQYMSPEQASGESVDQQSDLFSLGSVLYALCTGRPPFRAESTYGVMRRISDNEPTPIRELNPDIPEWLSQIIERLMAKQKPDRFGSAEEVHKLLEACLNHVQQPTVVELPEQLKTTASGKATLHCRSRLGWLMGGLAMVAFLFVGIVYYIQTNKGTLRVEVLDESLAVTIKGNTVTMQDGNKEPMTLRAGEHKLIITQGEVKLIAETFQLRRRDKLAFKAELLEGKVVLSEQGKVIGSTDLVRREPTHVGEKLATSVRSTVPTGEVEPSFRTDGYIPTPFRMHGRVHSLEYSPDGKSLLASGSHWGAALFDAKSGKILLRMPKEGMNLTADFSPNAKRIALAEYHGGDLQIWDVESGKEVATLPMGRRVAKFSSDGTMLFTVSPENLLTAYDLDTVKTVRLDNDRTFSPDMIATSPAGTLVAAVARDGKLRVWDWKARKRLAEIDGAAVGVQNCKAIVFTPNGKSLVVLSSKSQTELRDASTLESKRTFDTGFDKLNSYSLAISGNGERLAIGCEFGRVVVFDVKTGTRIHTRKVRNDCVAAVALSPDGRYLACGSEVEGGIHVLDIDGESQLIGNAGLGNVDTAQPVLNHLLTVATPEGIDCKNADIRISHDQSMVLVGKNGKHLLAIDEEHRIAKVEPVSGWRGMQFIPGTTRIVTKTWDKVGLVNPDKPLLDSPTFRHKMVEGDWIDPEVSPNGKFLATRPKLDQIRFSDLETYKSLGEPIAAGGRVSRMHFTSDSKYLCVYTGHGLSLWNPETGGRIAGPFPDGDYPHGLMGMTAYDPVSGRVVTIENSPHKRPGDLESRVVIHRILGEDDKQQSIEVPAATLRVLWADPNHLIVWGARKEHADDVEGYLYDTYPLFLIRLGDDSPEPIELAKHIWHYPVLTPDGQNVIGASHSETLCWAVGQSKPLWRSPGRAKDIRPANGCVLLRGFHGSLKIHAVTSGEVLQNWNDKWDGGMATHVSGNRIWLFDKEKIEVWAVATGADDTKQPELEPKDESAEQDTETQVGNTQLAPNSQPSVATSSDQNELVIEKLTSMKPDLDIPIVTQQQNRAPVLLYTVDSVLPGGKSAAICDIHGCRIAVVGADITTTRELPNSFNVWVSGSEREGSKAENLEMKDTQGEVFFSSKYQPPKTVQKTQQGTLAKCSFHNLEFTLSSDTLRFDTQVGSRSRRIGVRLASEGVLVLVDAFTGKNTYHKMKPISERVRLEKTRPSPEKPDEAVIEKLSKMRPRIDIESEEKPGTAPILLYTVEGKALEGKPAAICDIKNCRIAIVGLDISTTRTQIKSLNVQVEGDGTEEQDIKSTDNKTFFSSEYQATKERKAAECCFHGFEFDLNSVHFGYGPRKSEGHRGRGTLWANSSNAGVLILVNASNGKFTTHAMKPQSKRVFLTRAPKPEASSADLKAQLSEYAAILKEVQGGLNAYNSEKTRKKLFATDPTLRGWEYHYLLSKSDGNQTQWDLPNRDGEVEGRVSCLAFTASGERLILGRHSTEGASGTVSIWDFLNDKIVPLEHLDGSHFTEVAVSPDGKTIAAAGHNGKVIVWDAGSGKVLQQYVGHNPDPKVAISSNEYLTGRSLAYSPDGKQIVSSAVPKASVASTHVLKVWSVESGKTLLTIEGEHQTGKTKPITSVAFSPDGKILASGGLDGNITLWDAKTGKELRSIEGKVLNILDLKFSPDGKRIACGSINTAIWDVATGGEISRLVGYRNPVSCLAFSPDGKRLITGGLDRTVRIWDANTGIEIMLVGTLDNAVNSVAISSDGMSIAAVGPDGTAIPHPSVWSFRIR